MVPASSSPLPAAPAAPHAAATVPAALLPRVSSLPGAAISSHSPPSSTPPSASTSSATPSPRSSSLQRQTREPYGPADRTPPPPPRCDSTSTSPPAATSTASPAAVYGAKMKALFEAPDSRILLSLPCLPRIAPTPQGAALPPSSPQPQSTSPTTFGGDPPPVQPEATTDQREAQPQTAPAATRSRIVAVSVVGNPDGVPTVLHYGLGGGRYLSWIFHDFARRSNLRLIVPDRPGAGLSDPWDCDASDPDPPPPDVATAEDASAAPDASEASPGKSPGAAPPAAPAARSRAPSRPRWMGGFLDWAGVVVQVVDRLVGPGRPFAQIGISCGSTYALAVARRFPERVLAESSLVLLCPWVPPSLPESPLAARVGRLLPQSFYVGILETGNWLTSDPWNLGWFGDLAGAFRWVGNVSAASTSAIAAAMSLRGELQHAAEASRPAFLGSLPQATSRAKDDNASTLPQLPTSTDTPAPSQPSDLTAGSPADTGPPLAAAPPPPFRITDAVAKLDAVSYTLSQYPGMTPAEAESATLHILRRTPPSDAFVPPPPPPGSTWESLRTDPAYARPGLGSPPAILPAWIHTDVDAELHHLPLGRRYRLDGAVPDFLHSLELTGPAGFDYSDVLTPTAAAAAAATTAKGTAAPAAAAAVSSDADPNENSQTADSIPTPQQQQQPPQPPPTVRVVAVHGAADPLVPQSSARAVAARCGWDILVVPGQGHNFADVDAILDAFRAACPKVAPITPGSRSWSFRSRSTSVRSSRAQFEPGRFLTPPAALRNFTSAAAAAPPSSEVPARSHSSQRRLTAASLAACRSGARRSTVSRSRKKSDGLVCGGGAAAGQDDDAVEEVEDVSARLVDGQQGDDAALDGERLDGAHDVEGGECVETGGRLIQEEQCWVCDELDAERNALAFAAGHAALYKTPVMASA
ncbi:hypothetical protein HK405_004869 [Cladochytrium tenue]|nr:hypothetical protein HK405_004869 [Cladochytrium tenue]